MCGLADVYWLFTELLKLASDLEFSCENLLSSFAHDFLLNIIIMLSIFSKQNRRVSVQAYIRGRLPC